jgi:hypothetical protein
MSRSPEEVDLYGRAARVASRQLGFCIIGSLVFGVLVLIGYQRPFGYFALGLGALIPVAAMRVADPTRWGSLRHLAETAEERRSLLLTLRTRLSDPATPAIATKYGALYLLSDLIVFIDSADVEVMRTDLIARISAGEDSRSKERCVVFELKNGDLVKAPMEAARAASAARRVQEHVERKDVAPAAA